MLKIDKNEYYKKFATVSVCIGKWSDTSICKTCNTNESEFMVFIGEGQRLSTLYKTCCSDCLSEVIKEATLEGKKDAEKMIKNAEQRQLKEALEIVESHKKEIRKIKLNKLEETK